MDTTPLVLELLLHNKMMDSPELIISTLNIQGQSGFCETKQKQIEHFLQYHEIDILHCQEIEIMTSTFQSCK